MVRGPLAKVESTGLAFPGGFAHLRLPFLGAALHFGGRDIFDMLRKPPLVPEGIADFAVAIAPEHIL